MPAPPDESEPAMVSATGVAMIYPERFVLAKPLIASKFACHDAANLVLCLLTRFLQANRCPLGLKTLYCAEISRRRPAMVPFFVQIKCKLGQSYTVANALAEAEIASEIYSTAGDYDLLVKFYVDNDTDIGHFINEKVQILPGIQDTHTIITFKAFGAT